MSSPQRRKRRKINIPLVKATVMFVAGGIIALGTGLTGIAGQIAATPTIEYLLGFAPAKSAATALAFALCAACAAIVGAASAGVPIDLGIALILALTGAIGVAAAAGPSRSDRLTVARRAAHTAVMLLMIVVLRQALSQRIGGMETLPYPALRTWWAIGATGILAGVLSSLLQISNGVLLVPALVFAVDRPIAEAVLIALMVSALASILPVVTSASQGLVTRGTSAWMMLGGLAGGLAGGWLLGKICAAGGTMPLVLFGLVAMFFSAWTLWRMT